MAKRNANIFTLIAVRNFVIYIRISILEKNEQLKAVGLPLYPHVFLISILTLINQ